MAKLKAKDKAEAVAVVTATIKARKEDSADDDYEFTIDLLQALDVDFDWSGIISQEEFAELQQHGVRNDKSASDIYNHCPTGQEIFNHIAKI